MLEVFAKQVPIRNTRYFRVIKRRLDLILVFLVVFLILVPILVVFLVFLILVPILVVFFVFLILVPILVVFLVFLILVPILVILPLISAIIVAAFAIRMRTAISSVSRPAHPHHAPGFLYKPALPICICCYWRE